MEYGAPAPFLKSALSPGVSSEPGKFSHCEVLNPGRRSPPHALLLSTRAQAVLVPTSSRPLRLGWHTPGLVRRRLIRLPGDVPRTRYPVGLEGASHSLLPELVQRLPSSQNPPQQMEAANRAWRKQYIHHKPKLVPGLAASLPGPPADINWAWSPAATIPESSANSATSA